MFMCLFRPLIISTSLEAPEATATTWEVFFDISVRTSLMVEIQTALDEATTDPSIFASNLLAALQTQA